MKSYTVSDPALGQITFQDDKRYLWLIAVAFPLIPFVAIGLVVWTGQEWTTWLPFLAVYALVPLFDYVFENDAGNPPEQIVPQLEADPYYRWIVYLAVVVHIVTLVGSAWFVASYEPGFFGLLGLSLLVGAISGSCLNLGHELGHKGTKTDQFVARIALAVPFYGHFSAEHNAGHHAEVATPEDTASARFGESIYKFSRREIPGGLRRGWHLEGRRLRRSKRRVLGVHNEILQSYALSVLLFGGMLYVFGWVVLPFLVLQTAFAWWQLTSANYVEHYGLLRRKRANGRYEPCKPQHSWNANHLASNLLLFHLERHSDHHANASRRYQSLRHYDDVPQLPSGYFGMFMLAYLPPLWFRVMNPRVLELVRGDLSRVNVDADWLNRNPQATGASAA